MEIKVVTCHNVCMRKTIDAKYFVMTGRDLS